MKVTVTAYLNVRVGKPSVNAPCYQYLSPGSELDVDGTFYKGDMYDGNDNWMKDAEGNYYWAGGLDVTQPAAAIPLQPVAATPVNTAASTGNTTTLTTANASTAAPVTSTPPAVAAESNAAVNYNTLIPGIPDDARKTLGAGVTIAIIDTGCVTTYPDLQNRIIDRHNAYDATPDAQDTSENSHGTFIAGLLCADSAELRGIAPAAKLIIVKVLGSLSVSSNAVYAGLTWLKNHHNDVDIVSMSMDLDPTPFESQLKITYSQFPATTMFSASAGDNGTLLSELSCYPASVSTFTGVGSMDAQVLAGNIGKLNSVARYIYPDTQYTSYKAGKTATDKGSSFATAISSGIMALLIANYKAKKIPYDRNKLLQDLDRIAGNVESGDFSNSIFKPYIKQAPNV